jgi:hypothetical protein
LSIRLVAQPVVHQPQHVRLRIVPPWKLQPVRDVFVGFLESGPGAGVHPEHKRLRRSIADAVGILEGELRLAVVC